ncbi:translation initiation factor IF-2 [Natranaerofaba carboxydovora]|uniref:translation initiation factor IF-2 n=1 Tax=Natranaerofaba carboxydovora TaxID=2742683 RepID=UPI001F139A34|nr:translation initiation factor IF-2 [Natranaerofaba carboxydovora]UMZ73410.1 Translation initiation factor IF-2 [Natranaerofaba carboxydovora]
MGKIRVYQLAKELGVNSKELVNTLLELDISVKNHMSTLEEEEAVMVKELYDVEVEDKTQDKDDNEAAEEKPGDNKEGKEDKDDADELVEVSIPITVGELAEKLEINSSDIITKLINKGMMVTKNQNLDEDTLEFLKEDFSFEIKQGSEEAEDEDIALLEEEPVGEATERPPVITVMGHVDHGKTKVLDNIRKTNVQEKEAGGITQHIGAYRVIYNNKTITFLDTPGHEAFTAMRARGAEVTDIAIIVVAADDGVMPQTVEAINHVKAAGVPMIVAINKIDKHNSNPDKVKQDLMEHGLVPEEWGGDTICVSISALKGEGLDELLEMIVLVAEMNELTAYPEKKAEGTVIEAELDKGRGPVGTVLVRDGTLKIGDSFVCGNTYGRVRAMVDDEGKKIKEAGPSTPVEIQGLADVPQAGEIFKAVKSEKLARSISAKRQEKQREKDLAKNQKVSLDDLYSQIQKGEVKELNIIIKGDVRGSVEALRKSLLNLNDEMEEVQLKVIHGGVGAITESDIMLANASGAIVIGFNVRPEPNSKKLAEKENIDIQLYTVIYEAIEDVKSAMAGMLDPEYKEESLGRIEVRKVFKVSGIGNIAGCYVLEGLVNNDSNIRVVRDGIVIQEDEIETLKRFKDDVKEVKKGYECGILLKSFRDVKEGDILEAYKYKEVARTQG